MASKVKDCQFNFRLTPEQTERLDKLASDMSFDAGKTITRASVLRVALAQLEEVYYAERKNQS